MTSKKQVLQQLLALTKHMLKQAKSTAWQEVAELEQQRVEELNKIASLSEYEQDVQLQSLLQELITLNSELEQLCQLEKQAVATQLAALSTSRQALNSYTRT